MRALAPLVVALLVAGGCGPNPAFKIAGESNDGGGTGGDAMTTGDEASSAGETAATPRCEPAPLEPYVDDVCAPSRFPFNLPNMASEPIFDDVACGTRSNVYVKRVGTTELQQCEPGCADGCDPTRTISISGFALLSGIDEVLPQLGECARLWHVSEAGVDNVCKSLGYAFWDADGGQQLRLAVTDDLNPFAGVAGLPISVTADADASVLCETPNLSCTIQSVVPLAVDLDGCEFDAAQNAEWTDIPFGGRDYKFSNRSYTCFTEGTPYFGWYLRRARP